MARVCTCYNQAGLAHSCHSAFNHALYSTRATQEYSVLVYQRQSIGSVCSEMSLPRMLRYGAPDSLMRENDSLIRDNDR